MLNERSLTMAQFKPTADDEYLSAARVKARYGIEFNEH